MEGNLRSKLALFLVAASLSAAAGQPLGCTEDYQCVGVDTASYCDKDTKMCRACIKCEDFKRSPPLAPSKCITSVVECGACFEGLVEDVQGDLHAQCAAREAVPPAYVWVAIALGGLLLFVVAVAIVVYVLRNTDTFRILASTRTSVRPGCPAGPAPGGPPSYEDAMYSSVRPESPSAPAPPANEEAASPFIKRPPPAPAREAAGAQAANYYNNPNYVRGPHLPSSQQNTERDPEPEYLHDENTAESVWTPADSSNNNAVSGENSESSSGDASSAEGSSGGGGAGAGAGALAAALAAARGAQLVRPPCQDAATPNKLPRLRQDTNNNRNNQERPDGEAIPQSTSGATFNIHVNVLQRNDLKL